jgi:hypothetical protein
MSQQHHQLVQWIKTTVQRVLRIAPLTNDDAITDGGLIDKTIDKVRMLHVFINFLKLIINAHLFLISN